MAGLTAALIGGIGSLAGGVANFAANSSANDRAKALQDKNLQEWLSLNVPDPEQQKVVLEKFVNQGTLDPVLQHAIKQDPSAFQQIVTSSGNKAAQNRALSSLEKQGYEGGLSLNDKATLQDATLSQQARDRGNRNAIQADMSRRGLGGSGFDVAAQLQGQQGTSDQAAQSSLKVAGDAQARALQSIQDAGNLATNYRTQDFGEQAQKASAQDRISQFNTQNAQNVNAANTASQNRAQELNLGNQQRISDQNTQLANSQQLYNKSLAQQQYENQMKKVAGASDQYGNLANSELRQGQTQGNLASNIGGSIQGVATSIGANDARETADSNYWSHMDDYLKKKKSGVY